MIRYVIGAIVRTAVMQLAVSAMVWASKGRYFVTVNEITFDGEAGDGDTVH
jgi:hypothetical protein